MGFTDLKKPKKTNGADNVNISNPNSTFGEVLVGQLDPVAQGDFVHGINSQIFSTSSFAGATISQSGSLAVLESGTDANGSATVQLRRRLEYRPGQGSMMRATAVLATSANIGGTTNKVLKSASMAAFTEGKTVKLDPKFAKSFSFSLVNSATYVPLAFLKANRVFDGESSFGEFDLLRVAGHSDTNKAMTIGLFLNAEVAGDVNFQEVNSSESMTSFATLDPATNTITDLANLSPFYELVIPLEGAINDDIADLSFVFGPGQIVLIAIKTSGVVTGQVGVTWFEQQ